MDRPLISVIVPAHNAEQYLCKALESVLRQVYRNYELIVICDACEDKTAVVARNYADFVYEVNYHRDGLTRNFGLDVAGGEWILFIDDDDWLLHEYCFQIIAETIGRNDEDIFFFDVIWKGRGYIAQSPDHIEKMTCGHLIRREFIGDTRFDDGEYSADIRFFDKLLQKHPMCAFLNQPMYYYNYMRPGSLSDRHAKGEI